MDETREMEKKRRIHRERNFFSNDNTSANDELI